MSDFRKAVESLAQEYRDRDPNGSKRTESWGIIADELEEILSRFPEQKPATVPSRNADAYARGFADGRLEKPADVGAAQPVAWMPSNHERESARCYAANLRLDADKRDCGPSCENCYMESDTGASICRKDEECDCDRANEWREAAKLLDKIASPPPATVANIPEGWVLVPKGTNWDMRNEAREYMISVGLNSGPLNLDKVAHAIWETMLAAAPKPGEGK